MDDLTRTDVQVLRNLVIAAERWFNENSGKKWLGECASARNLIRDAERIIERLGQQAGSRL